MPSSSVIIKSGRWIYSSDIIYFVMFCLLSALSCCAQSDEKQQSNQELTTINVEELKLRQTLDQLFGQHQPGESALMPARTLALLKHLENMYTLAKNEPKRIEVANLIDMSNLAADCDRELFSKLNSNIETYTKLESKQNSALSFGNILTYLEFSRKKLFLHCEQALAEDIRFYVDQSISSEDRNSVILLREKVFTLNYGFNPDRPYFSIPKRVLKEGILDYIQLRLNGKFDSRVIEDKRVGVYYFEEDFTRLVTKVCKSVKKVLDPIITLYDLYVGDTILTKQFDKQTLYWITNTRLCREIMIDLEFIRKGTYEILLERAAQPKKKNTFSKIRDHLVSCFEPECL